MEQAILNFAQSFDATKSVLAYIFFFFNSSMQALFPPYPGDTIIVFQGYIGTLGVFNNFLIVFATLLGTLVCNVGVFLFCHKNGDKILNNKFFTKFFSVEKIEGLKKVFNKYGAALIAFNRFVPGLGMITVISAGIFKINKFKAIVAACVASTVHNLLLLSLGYTVGYNIPLLKSIMFRFNKFFIILAVIIGIAALVVYIKKKGFAPVVYPQTVRIQSNKVYTHRRKVD